MNHAEKIKRLAAKACMDRFYIQPDYVALASQRLFEAAIDEMQAEIDRLKQDAARLDWMSSREARIGWNREGDMCWVWVRDDDEACGWSTDWSKSFATHREAIDAAMKERGEGA